MKPTLIAVHLTLLTGTCLCQSALNVSQLHDDLLTLNPNVRPVSDVSEPTEVNVTFQLLSIVSLDTASQKLVSNGWMSVYWQNDYMTWDPEDYGGIKTIVPESDAMWRPRLAVVNTLKDIEPMGKDHIFMTLDYDGLVSWFPGERFETFCEVDVTFFPFDSQTCTWQLLSWGDTVESLNLHHLLPYIQMDGYQENGEWNLIASEARAKIKTYHGVSNRFLFFEVTLQRRPLLLTMTTLLPPLVLSVVSIFVFTIPSESGERLAYSMTSFLTFGVFMSYIIDLLPSSSQNVSILAVILTSQLIFSATFVLLCILSLRLFHRDSIKHPVPPTLHTAIVHLEMLMCLDPPSQGDEHKTQTQDVIPSQGDEYKTQTQDVIPSQGDEYKTQTQDVIPSQRDEHKTQTQDVIPSQGDEYKTQTQDVIPSQGDEYKTQTQDVIPSQRDEHKTQTQDVIASDASADFFEAEVKGGRLNAHLDKCAKERKEKQEAYSQPQDMTWQRVSRTLDKLLFRVIFTLVAIGDTMFIAAVAFHYNSV